MVGLIYIQDIKNCPFLSKYTEIFEKEGIEYKVIYWNRKSSSTKATVVRNKHLVEYQCHQNIKLPKYRKLLGFVKYGRFLIHETKDCEKVILLTTITALIFLPLISKFRNKYIFDYRDPLFENYNIFQFILKYIIKNSYFTCISSVGFKRILPKYDYLIAHNFRYEDLKKSESFIPHKPDSRLNIIFLGALREARHICHQIDLFGDDPRFNLYYYGWGSDSNTIEAYSKNKFSNVFIMGPYDNEDKTTILALADVINDHNPTDHFYQECTANKMYDSIIFKIPILSNRGSIDGQISEEYGFGFSTRLESKADLDNLYEWFFSLSKTSVINGCNSYFDKVLKDDKKYLDEIIRFGKK